MRRLLTIFFILFSTCCYAQQQNVFFVKNNGTLAANKDSADYVRIVTTPEKGTDHFTVAEYYISGKKRRIYNSRSSYPVIIDGPVISFYPNGARKSIETYTSGHLSGSSYEYFPNGKLYIQKDYTTSPKPEKPYEVKYTIQVVNDSMGKAMVTDGTGVYQIYDKDFKEITEEGPVKLGKRDGTWKGFSKAPESTFEEEYANGELISGKAVYDGKTLTYSKARSTSPRFPGGDQGLGRFIGRQIRYPVYERENGVQGQVITTFEVGKDGKLSIFQIVQSVSEGLDNEALKMLKNSPPWEPGTLYGIPITMKYTVPIGFALGGR
jgi:TonB family protein